LLLSRRFVISYDHLEISVSSVYLSPLLVVEAVGERIVVILPAVARAL
jgi:hypothetical protein